MKATNETKAANQMNVEINKVVTSEESKSKKMLELYKLNVPIKDIATMLSEHYGQNVRYNFVYNVVSNFCNVTGQTIATEKKEGKNKLIVDMFLQGKSNKEISIELKTNYNYVFNTIKKYKLENPGTIEE